MWHERDRPNDDDDTEIKSKTFARQNHNLLFSLHAMYTVQDTHDKINFELLVENVIWVFKERKFIIIHSAWTNTKRFAVVVLTS